MSMTQQRRAPQPSSDGADSYLTDVRKAPLRERYAALRDTLESKLIGCPDCRSLRNAMLILMDTLIGAEGPQAALPAPGTSEVTVEHGNSSVTMSDPVPTPGAGVLGQEVAPGVVIMDPPPGWKPPAPHV